MPKIKFIEPGGAEHLIEAQLGMSVMQTARDHYVPGILGDCGGCCACGTCHGYVDAQHAPLLSPRSADEELVLEGLSAVEEDSRLTCQIVVTPALDGLVIRLPLHQY